MPKTKRIVFFFLTLYTLFIFCGCGVDEAKETVNEWLDSLSY